MYWYMEAMRKYAVFTGRARRREYWMFQLINLAIITCFAFLLALLIPATVRNGRITMLIVPIVVVIGYVLATIVPSLAVSVRRLHDTNLSGWWTLIALVPAGGIVLFVFHLLDSNPGPNQYGPNPKGVNVAINAAPLAAGSLQPMTTAAAASAALPDGQWFLGYCTKCGTQMQGGARFCPQCGQAAY